MIILWKIDKLHKGAKDKNEQNRRFKQLAN